MSMWYSQMQTTEMWRWMVGGGNSLEERLSVMSVCWGGVRSHSFTHAHPQRRGCFLRGRCRRRCALWSACGWMEDRAKRLRGSGGTQTDWTE